MRSHGPVSMMKRKYATLRPALLTGDVAPATANLGLDDKKRQRVGVVIACNTCRRRKTRVSSSRSPVQVDAFEAKPLSSQPFPSTNQAIRYSVMAGSPLAQHATNGRMNAPTKAKSRDKLKTTAVGKSSSKLYRYLMLYPLKRQQSSWRRWETSRMRLQSSRVCGTDSPS